MEVVLFWQFLKFGLKNNFFSFHYLISIAVLE